MFKTLRPLRWITVGLAAVVLFHVTIENSAAKKWEVVSELPTGRSAFSTVVADGKIYLIGGTLLENESSGPFGLPTVEVYDPHNNSWKKVADMPTPRSNAEAAVVDGKIYVVGGLVATDRRMESTKILKVVEVYDPHTDTWERKQDMSQRRLSFGIGVVERKIYVMGGANFFENQWRLDHVEAYDPDTDIWHNRPSLLTRRDGFETAVVEDSIYVIGGRGWPSIAQNGPYLATIDVYEPGNRWRQKTDLPSLRYGFSAVVVADEIYLIGGLEGAAFDRHVKTVESYHTKAERWRIRKPMPIGNTPFGVATVNQKIYVLGSEREGGELSLDVEVFKVVGVSATDKLSVRWGELKTQDVSQP